MRQVFNRLFALIAARNKEFYRDRASLSWAFVFPLLIIVGFSFAFGSEKALYKVAYVGEAPRASPFFETSYIEFVAEPEMAPALAKMRQFKFDLLITEEGYWVNTTSPNGYVVEKLLLASQPPGAAAPARHELKGEAYRYIDWLIPGVIGMNLMFSALFGVGYSIVRYRKTGVLKRLKATPLRAWEFLVAQIFSRLLLIFTTSAVLLAGVRVLVGFRMLGSYFDLAVFAFVGVFALIALGLVVAARFRSEEVASGLLNFLSWPMMFLSGVWFSLEGAHPVLKKLSAALPLTHLIEGSRDIMLEGATLTDVAPKLVVLAGMAVVYVGFASWWFRWD